MRKNKTKEAPAKRKKTPGKGAEKGGKIAKRGNAQTAKAGQKSPAGKPRGNVFDGATEISMTENKIAITRSTASSSKGSSSTKTTRIYVDKTPANMRAFSAAMSGRGVKKLTVKLK